MTDLPQILIGRTTGMILAWFWDSKLTGKIVIGKIGKIVISDQARINGGSIYEYPGQRWVPKLVNDMYI